MTFRVGMKVVCIGSFRSPPSSGEVLPIVGGVYTVRGIFFYKGECGLHLEEIRNPKKQTVEGEMERFMWAQLFRPAVQPGISFDTSIPADPDSEQYDNRRRIPVSEWGCSA